MVCVPIMRSGCQGLSALRHHHKRHLNSMISEKPTAYCRASIGPCLVVMSASLIGRLGSSVFRLSTDTVSMSPAGSCFSPESAPGPFHHGIRGQGGTIPLLGRLG